MNVYKKAAKLIVKRQTSYTWIAIMLASDFSTPSAHYSTFLNTFEPADFGDPQDEQNQLARTLALLLMAELRPEERVA